MSSPSRFRPWRDAWHDACVNGFWPNEGPADHFRTSVGDAPELMAAGVWYAIARGLPGGAGGLPGGGIRRIIDIGAGDGGLLTALSHHPGVGPQVELVGIDLRARPSALPERVGWEVGHAPASLPPGLPGSWVVLHELLDEIPLDIAQRVGDGWHYVDADYAGSERVGQPVRPNDAAWLAAWAPDGLSRVEIGRARDEVLREILAAGHNVLAVDYPCTAGERTLVGHRQGLALRPQPDGTMNLTAHVCLDSLRAEAGAAEVATQRAVLRAAVPAADATNSALESLRRRAALDTLTDPGGLGRFFWLRANGIRQS